MREPGPQNRGLLWGWILYLILFPFYVFESGMPQPADWLLALLIGYVFLSGVNFLSWTILPARALRYFVLYVFIVNTAWAFFIDQSMEKRFPSYFHTLFYIFNYLTFCFALYLYSTRKSVFFKYTAYGVSFSLILQMVLSFAGSNFSGRESLFFNNPNQLGYYALLYGTILVYLSGTVNLALGFQIAGYLAFLYLCLLSSSKAAMAGSIVLVLVSSVNKGALNVKHVLVILILIFIGNYFITNTEIGSNLYNYAFNRFYTIGYSRDDSVEGRGYDRMLNDPEYMILGAGEGGYYRFDTLLYSGEIHSSFGTILFCYGILGFSLFVLFLLRVFKYSTLLDFIYFIPVIVYSITHQGLRATPFWVLLALFYATGVDNKTSFITGVK